MQQIILILGFILSSMDLFSSTPGTFDTSFNGTGYAVTDIGSGTTDMAYGSAVQPDGKIVVVGSSGTSMALTRYTITGSLDTQFNANGIVTQAIGSAAMANDVVVQNDGKIVVAGSSDTHFFVARFLPNGSLDTAGFNALGTPGYVIQQVTTGSNDSANSVVVDTSGNIIVVGSSMQTGVNNIFAAQYSASGILNTTTYNMLGTASGTGTAATIPGIALVTLTAVTLTGNGAALDANGKLVVVGSTGANMIVARFTTDGTLDTATFNTGSTPGYIIQSVGGSGSAYGVAFQRLAGNAGSIIVSGTDATNACIVRFTSAGVLDTTFGIASSGYNAANAFGGTSTTAYGVVIESDDKIVVGGAVLDSGIGDFFVACYLVDGSALDTATFNPPQGYNATNINAIEIGRTLSLQSNGRFIVAGTSGSGATDFGIARYLGRSVVPGCMNVNYPTSITGSSIPGYVTFPTSAVSSQLPRIKSLQALSNNNVYVLSENLASPLESQLVQLSASGAVAASNVDIAQIGAQSVIVDSQQRALVVGTNASAGWLARYVVLTGSMAIDQTFNAGTIIVDSVDSSSYSRVCEQKARRVIVIGQATVSANGLLIGYNEEGVLATSSQTLCPAFGSGGLGFATLPSMTFCDMVIDSNDGIYVACQELASTIKIVKYLADGSGLDTSLFGTAGIVDTGLSVASYGKPSITFDKLGNIVLAAVNTSTGTMVFQGYAPATGTTSVGTGAITQAQNLLTNPVITQLQCDTSGTNGMLVCTGYDANVFFVAALQLSVATYALDTTFSSYGSTQGILKTMYDSVNPSRVSNCLSLAPNGAILFGGYEVIDGSHSVSIVGQVVPKTPSSPQVARYPGAQLTGVIDTSFGTAGALNLTASPALLSQGQAQALLVLPNNKMLLAVTNGTDTVMSQLTSSYALDTASFGSGTGSLTLTGLAIPKNIMTDVAGNIYVVGSNAAGTASILTKITSNGSAIVWTSGVTITTGNAVRQQASGRILLAGYDATYNAGAGSGVIVAYNPSTGALDTSFNATAQLPGAPGYYYTGVAHPITSLSVCTTATTADKIVYAYANGTTAMVGRLLENGTGLDTTFTFGTGIASISADNQIRMQLDATGKIVLVARTATGCIASRYTQSGANDVINVSIPLDNPSTCSLKKIQCLSDGSTLILATNTNGTTLAVASLRSDFALNVNFDPAGTTPGILQTAVAPMIDFYGIDVTSDQGIILSGDTHAIPASASPYMTRIVNDVSVTKVNQSTASTPGAGLLDTTFNTTGTTIGFMNIATELTTTNFPTDMTPQVLLQQTNGTYYIGGSTGTNSYVTLMNSGDVQNSTFGRVTIAGSGKTNLSSMLITQTGSLLVAGAGAGTTNSGWLVNLNATTGEVLSAFAPTIFLDSIYAVAQQTNGRILAAGIRSGVGTIIAYNSVTGAVDTTFAANGIYTATGYGAIHSMIVDAVNNVYHMANDTGNNAQVIKLAPSGVAASGWTIPTISANSTLAENNHLASNQAGNIVAVAVDTTTPQIVVNVVTASSGAQGTPLNLPVASTTIVTPHVTSLCIDLNASPGKVILTGYDSLTTPNIPFIIRINATLTALDTTFNGTGVQVYNLLTLGVVTHWYASMINADGKITVAGDASILDAPYMMRVYGDEFIGQYSPSLTPLAAGVAGTIDTTFGTAGKVGLANVSGSLIGSIAQVVIPLLNGSYYVGLRNATSVISQVVRLTNAAIVDTSFGSSGFGANLQPGVTDMIIDGLDQLVVIGNNGGVGGWITRYAAGNTGVLDPSFNGDGIVNFNSTTLIYKVVQQTLGRYVVAGQLPSGNAGLLAVVNNGSISGAIDTTFGVAGYYDTGVAGSLHAVISDVYDRLIIAYKNGAGIDIQRLTSAGQLDTTFGTAGTITGAIANADNVTQVCLTFDTSGNIIVAAHINDGADKITVKGYANGSGTTSIATQINITGLVSPIMTNMIAAADGTILVSGNQSAANAMWVARVKNNGSGAYIIDTTFAPAAIIPGIMQFSFDGAGTVTSRAINAIAVYGDGQIAMVGAETNSANTPNVSSFVSMAYDNPYTSQIINYQGAQPNGDNDTTLGASPDTVSALGVTFFASSGATTTSGQVARAIALQDPANILVAVDGGISNGSTTPSTIFLKMFTIDGTPNTTFGTDGEQTVLSMYANQYVQDMVTSTISGVHTAILAGYIYNNALPSPNQYSSLLLQYNLDTKTLDNRFGGYDGNSLGVAFGHSKQLFSVGQQSNGRIIATGTSQDTAPLGLLLGYTVDGMLDSSFGSNGYRSIFGSTAVYTQAIDTQNRIVIAYQDGSGQVIVARLLEDGSGLDTSFNGGSINTLSVTLSSSSMRVAVDGSNNIFVGMVAGNQQSMTIFSYDVSGGVLYAPLTTSLGATLTQYTITTIMVTTDSKVIVLGYDANAGSNDQLIIVRFLADLSNLDATFNAADTPGYIKYAVSSGAMQIATDGLIHPDGRIIVVGAQA